MFAKISISWPPERVAKGWFVHVIKPNSIFKAKILQKDKCDSWGYKPVDGKCPEIYMTNEFFLIPENLQISLKPWMGWLVKDSK